MSLEVVKQPKTVVEEYCAFRCDACGKLGPDTRDDPTPPGWVFFGSDFEETKHACGYACMERYAVKMQCQEASA